MATEFTCITRKIEVHLHQHGDSEEAKQRLKDEYKIWNEINDNLYKAANRIMSHYFLNDEYESRMYATNPRYQEIEKILKHCKRDKLSQEEIDNLKQEKKELEKLFTEQKKEFLGISQEHNTILKTIRKEFKDVIPGEILDCLILEKSKYTEKRIDIKKGECSVPNYRKGMPIPFRIKIGPGHKTLGIFRRDNNPNNIYVKFPKGLEWDLNFGRDRSNNREIVERILSGQYDVGNSSIQEAKNNKRFLLLVVKIPKVQNNLNPERVVGVDLGINVPLYAALNDNEYGGMSIGSREQFLNMRMRMQAQKRELQRNLRHTTNGGHGRNQKLQAFKRLQDKEKNWVHLQNHIFSKSIIEFALKNKAGVIQMERLTGFGRNKNDEVDEGYKFILRYWSYFELQTMIEYKANAAGIEVRYIDPYHTSQTCSFCGHREKGQRISQSMFVCKNPDCTKGKGKQEKDGTYKGINADWNAARNIALSKKVVDRKKK